MKAAWKKFLQSEYRYPALFLLGLCCITAMYLYKAPLEIPSTDESFYLMLPKRLLDGDSLFVDEWHGTQMSAFLLYPLLWAHQLLFGYEGILLHFRYIYVVFQVLCAVVLYLRLRQHKLFGVLAAWLFFLFTPFDIMALSYNTMGLMLLTLTIVLLATAKSKRVYAISGFLFAGAVLCCPYLLLGYAVYSAAAVVYGIATGHRDAIKAWGCFTLGAAALALLFFAFVLSRTSLGDIFRALPHIFSDPEHPSKGFFSAINGYLFACATVVRPARIGLAIYLVYLAALIAALVDKRRSAHRLLYLGVSIASALAMLCMLARRLPNDNYHQLMYPLALVGLMAYLVTDKRNHRLFLFTFCGGFVYAFCTYFSSNQGSNIIMAASVTANVASILLLGDALRELRADGAAFPRPARVAAGILVPLLFLTQFSLMGYVKLQHKFWSETPNAALTAVIPAGPCRGIHVTPETHDIYMQEYETLLPLTKKEGRVLYVSSKVWYYLATPNLRVGSLSAWMNTSIQTTPYLASYYQFNSENLPEHILISPEVRLDMDAFQELILEPYGYRPAEPIGDLNYYIR